jgi:uncharacterized oxidoreductase
MPVLSDTYLHRVAYHIFKGIGAPPEEAQIVADHLIGANLAGHDSHGIIQTIAYVDRIRKGQLKPGAQIEVLAESPATARINGNWGFGYVVTSKAVQMAAEKAKKNNVAAISILQQGHIGRLADYTCALAKEGMIGQITADSGRTAKAVAPFGGRVPCLGTNPISIAIPSNQEGPVFIDMATSTVASGKINVAKSRGEQVPEGWLLDKDGNPTTDPNDFAAIMPLGGEQGHKGYGLAFMIEVFAGLLTGIGFGVDPAGWHNDGCLLLAINVEAFRPLDEFKAELDDMIRQVKSTPPLQGVKEVMYPGEPEWRTAQRKAKEGIFIEDATWAALQDMMQELDVAGEVGQP